MIQVTDTDNIYELLFATVIHRDNDLLIIAIDVDLLPDDDSEFWTIRGTAVYLAEGLLFTSEAFAHTETIKDVAILKFYNKEPDLF